MVSSVSSNPLLPSLPTLARNWWAIVLRGIFAVLFGVLALTFARATLVVLVLVFGVYALLDGIFAVVAAVRAAEHHARWFVLLLEGLAGILVGIIAFFFTGLTALALLYLIAAWAIVTGVAEIVSAVRLRREVRNEWFYVISGVLSILFGAALVIFPGAGALAVVWLIGLYALLFGVVLIGLGLRLRGMRLVPMAPSVPANQLNQSTQPPAGA